MVCPYALESFSEQLNIIKMGDYGITLMGNFAGTTTDINLKNHHTWVCPVYVLDAIFQGNISGLPKW